MALGSVMGNHHHAPKVSVHVELLFVDAPVKKKHCDLIYEYGYYPAQHGRSRNGGPDLGRRERSERSGMM